MTESTSPPSGPPAPRRRIWMRVLLFASLALNLAVAGIVAGAMLKGVHDDQPERLSRELGLGPFLRALDDDKRQALREAAQARRGELAEGRQAWRAAFSETLDLLREETFDQERFESLVERQAEIAARGRALGQEELARQLAAMPVEARRAFADRLEQGLRFHGRFRNHGRREDGMAPERQP
ncbi:periplasmic heavy metal sensor [Tropicimonas isoalkanivorans]|uniref:Uncharacterized membrane protein n=1 Tax=Tropicimonas isoalkanivorans TaxID=441112 RepID=A0A1I1LAV8_9RHOB|nr:periplasmic heavy metal sensor [Tropicimonas isoalkanivorans]SFC70161.1 Uncharacterized membrane protein [Tropicimonas isoalkanivorans]